MAHNENISWQLSEETVKSYPHASVNDIFQFYLEMKNEKVQYYADYLLIFERVQVNYRHGL
jgi:hypothetical protein